MPIDPHDDRPPRWWLVTFNTYGTWLPGDPRGFQTWRGKEYVPPPKRYAKVGEATYDPAPHRARHAAAKRSMTHAPVTFTRRQVGCCREAIADELALLPLEPASLAVGDWHVHALVRVGGYPLRTAVGRLKAAASRLLSQYDLKPAKVWADGCHLVSKDDDAAVRKAFDYVRDHAEEGALVQTWFHPLGDALPDKPR